MPSWTKLVGGWLLAAAIAIAFSWGAVAQVRNRVIQPTIEIPTTVAVAAAPTSTTTGADPTVIRVEPEVISDTTTSSTQPESGPTSTATTTTTAVQTGGTTTTQPPAATTTTTTTAPTTTTEPPATTTTTTTTTTAAPPEIQTGSYQLEGGVVTISYSPGVVNFVSAIPQPGYSTDKRETGPDRVRIRFESEGHTSDFRAEWEGGELKITKNETGEDS